MKLSRKRKDIKSNKGITLIALVITIIVLLILAGVSISMITGQSNIMGKAQEAVIKTKNAEELEKVQLAVVNAMAASNLGVINPNDNSLETLRNGLAGVVENVSIIPMTLSDSDEEQKKYYFTAKIELTTGGNYGYTFRVMPKHEMLLDAANLDLIKWITK